MTTLLALLACSQHLPTDAEAPRPGSLEDHVVDLPESGVASDWFTHWKDPEKLLVRMSSDLGSSLVVVDHGALTSYCNTQSGGYGGPYRIGWTNDVGQWDVIDGRLYLRADDDFIASCGTDGAVTRVDAVHTSWPTVAAMTDGGYLSWRQDAPRPSFFHWTDGSETEIAWTGPAPVAVVKRRDAGGMWFITDVDGTITLWDLDAATLEITELFRADLAGVRAEVWSVHPDALVILTDQGLWAASGTVGGGFHPVDPGTSGISATDAYYPWPSGRGFSVWGRSFSVNLAEDRVITEGKVTPLGQHFTLEGPPEATNVTVYDNDLGETVTTWTADLSTHFDWLDGVAAEATYEAIGFTNGTCGVMRWGSSWGMDGDPVPYETGEVGWHVADSVVYLGRCDEPMERVTAELWNDLAYLPIPTGRVLKTDLPVFTLTSGVRTEDGFSSLSAPFAGFDIWQDGWGIDDNGGVVPLFEEVDNWIGQRQGTTFWTLNGRSLSRVDAARQLE